MKTCCIRCGKSAFATLKIEATIGETRRSCSGLRRPILSLEKPSGHFWKGGTRVDFPCPLAHLLG
jgi:hypothetical protein